MTSGADAPHTASGTAKAPPILFQWGRGRELNSGWRTTICRANPYTSHERYQRLMRLVFQSCAIQDSGYPPLWCMEPFAQEVPSPPFAHATRQQGPHPDADVALAHGFSLGFSTGARSVHSTSAVDVSSRATDAASWSVGAETSFTQEAASHTSHGGRPTLDMLHNRPLNLDTMTVWSSTSRPIQTTQRRPDGPAHGQPVRRLNSRTLTSRASRTTKCTNSTWLACSKFPTPSPKTPFESR